MSASAKNIADTLRMVAKLDREWLTNPAGRDEPGSLPWMPFSVPDFIALVAEALPEISGDRFLEIGAGIGTKMLLAQEIFGLDVMGFDRVREYVRQARELGVRATEEDALGYRDYGEYDLLFLNLTFRDPALERELEQKVWADMKSGAVVICANLLGRPPENWWLILDDMEVKRGIWQKP